MPTLVRDPQPAEFEALLERRRRLGQDLFDEVWEGVLHMNPAPSGRHGRIEAQLLAMLHAPATAAGLIVFGQFNLGDNEHDYRVPDGGLHRDFADRVFYPTAALVIEIVAPGGSSGRKGLARAGSVRAGDELDLDGVATRCGRPVPWPFETLGATLDGGCLIRTTAASRRRCRTKRAWLCAGHKRRSARPRPGCPGTEAGREACPLEAVAKPVWRGVVSGNVAHRNAGFPSGATDKNTS